MYAFYNKFDIGDECYSVYRRPVHYECPICKGNGEFEHNGYKIRCSNCNGTGKLHKQQFIMEVFKGEVRGIKVSISKERQLGVIRYKIVANDNIYTSKKHYGSHDFKRSETTVFKTREEAEQYCVKVNIKEIPAEF